MVEKLREFSELLLSNKKICVSEDSEFIDDEIDTDVLSWSVEEIKQDLNIEFSKELLFADDLAINWEVSQDYVISNHISGGCYISIYNGLLGDEKDWLLENPLMHSERLLKNLKVFNESTISPYQKQKGVGCFCQGKNAWPRDIYFFDSGVRIKMDLTLDEYIQALIDSCAVAYWQYFYVDMDELIDQNSKLTLRKGTFANHSLDDETLDSARLPYLINELEIVVKHLPDLFPEKDFTYHKDRLALIKEKAKPFL